MCGGKCVCGGDVCVEVRCVWREGVCKGEIVCVEGKCVWMGGVWR